MSAQDHLPFDQYPEIQKESAAMQRIKQRAAAAIALAASKEAETPVPFIIPGVSESAHAIPNYIARTSIFAPIRRGYRCMHNDAVFLEGQNILIKGSGPQLSEDQSDIWMHAMYLQTTTPVGIAPIINRADFLRALGRTTAGPNYVWLHSSMKALAKFTLEIEARRKDGTIKYSFGTHASSRVLHMMGGFDYNEAAKTYTLYVDPRWSQIFGNREYALVDWVKRRQMRHDLTKSLQRLVGTSADTLQRYGVELLKARAAYTGPVNKFITTLESSLRELEILGVIANPRIEASSKRIMQAVWTRLER